jgi:L-threonylcarbamoyladenylate synthase
MRGYNQKQLKKISQHIRRGGLIAYPTEHCYGIGCDPFNREALRALIKVKGRNPKKGFIVIASKVQQLSNIVVLPSNANEFNTVWPGPVTLLLEAQKHKVHQILTGKHKTVAVRVSKHKLVQQLCNFINSPLVSTSANFSGLRPSKTYKDCLQQLGRRVMVLPGLTNFAPNPSTIIDWRSKKRLR